MIFTNCMKNVDRGVSICYKKRLCSLKLSHCRGCHLSCRHLSTSLCMTVFRSGRQVDSSALFWRDGHPVAAKLIMAPGVRNSTITLWSGNRKLGLRTEQHDYSCAGIVLNTDFVKKKKKKKVITVVLHY